MKLLVRTNSVVKKSYSLSPILLSVSFEVQFYRIQHSKADHTSIVKEINMKKDFIDKKLLSSFSPLDSRVFTEAHRDPMFYL